MNFVSSSFAVFFLVVLAGFFLLQNYPSKRGWFLLCANVIFYAFAGINFVPLLLTSAGINWIAGRVLFQLADTVVRKRILCIAVGVNLALLALFKYYEFFFLHVNDLLLTLGISAQIPMDFADIAFPIGISFYTFQGIAYCVEQYRHQEIAPQPYWRVLVYLSFFPTVLAGPIMRPSQFFPQFQAFLGEKTTPSPSANSNGQQQPSTVATIIEPSCAKTLSVSQTSSTAVVPDAQQRSQPPVGKDGVPPQAEVMGQTLSVVMAMTAATHETREAPLLATDETPRVDKKTDETSPPQVNVDPQEETRTRADSVFSAGENQKIQPDAISIDRPSVPSLHTETVTQQPQSAEVADNTAPDLLAAPGQPQGDSVSMQPVVLKEHDAEKQQTLVPSQPSVMPVDSTENPVSVPPAAALKKVEAATVSLHVPVASDDRASQGHSEHLTEVRFEEQCTPAQEATEQGAMRVHSDALSVGSSVAGLDTPVLQQASALILSGLFKKVVLASYLSEMVVRDAFQGPEGFSSLGMLVAVYGYAIQIFCDFSGYTDLAIGVALFMGFKLPENFNSPYLACSLQDFWRRWHISLSSWLRDYLYIPLGGSKKGNRYVNLLLTMVLGGLWHGAHMRFIIWGMLHGLGLVVVHALQAIREKFRAPGAGASSGIASWCEKAFCWLLTFHFVAFAWIFFHAEDMERALEIIRRILLWGYEGEGFAVMAIPAIGAGLALQVAGSWIFSRFVDFQSRQHLVVQAAVVTIIAVAIFRMGPDGVLPFIYFQF